MIWILVIGSVIAIVNVVLTYSELIPFLKAKKQLDEFTKSHPTPSNFFMYPFRFMTLLPKATPLLLDIVVAVACGSIGLGGGVYGALIGLTIGFTASLLIKFHRHYIAPKIRSEVKETWKVA